MWNSTRLTMAIELQNEKLNALNKDKESHAARGNWSVVTAIKQEIQKVTAKLNTYKEILEADE